MTPADALKAAINVGGWNTIHIIARKELVVHAVNGKVSAVFLDGDAAKRPADGFIGLQLHTGPPMRAEFRNVAIQGPEVNRRTCATSTPPTPKKACQPRGKDRVGSWELGIGS